MEGSMRKLKLELEELSVESFDTAQETEERGTVHGNYVTQFCSGANGFTCFESCGGSCADTCGASCDTCDSGCYMTPPIGPTAYYMDTQCIYG
jgi:hypothetical protein